MKKYTWDIVTDQSAIILKAKYHIYGNIAARFSKFSGCVVTEESFTNPEISLAIETASINTQNVAQDELFKSVTYFSVFQYPAITFYSLNGCGLSGGGIQELTGELFIKGTKRFVTLIVTLSEIKSLSGGASALFHLYGRLDLKDWGMGKNEAFEIGDEMLIIIEMALLRRKRSSNSLGIIGCL